MTMKKRKRVGAVKSSVRGNKFPSPKKPYYTVAQVRKALRLTGGVKTDAARYLQQKYGRGCGRSSVIDNYLNRHPALRRYLKRLDEANLDMAESQLLRMMRDEKTKGHASSVFFFLRTKGKARGYTERQEVTGADGGPIAHSVAHEIDLSKLSDVELSSLEKLLTKAEVKDGRVMGAATVPSSRSRGKTNGQSTWP